MEIDERVNYGVKIIQCCLNCTYHETDSDMDIGCRLHRFHRLGEAYWTYPVSPLGYCDKYFDERKYNKLP